MELDNNAHSVFLRHYHPVLVVNSGEKSLMILFTKEQNPFLSILLLNIITH